MPLVHIFLLVSVGSHSQINLIGSSGELNASGIWVPMVEAYMVLKF
jgi:hypothetical protein